MDDNYAAYGCFKIPYAKPPIGSLRFMPPEPYDTVSNQVVGASGIDGTACVDSDGEGDEDCLFVSVFTPGHFSH